MRHWLPDLIAKVPASVHSKLLISFLSLVALLILFGAVVIQAMGSMYRHADELIELHQKTAAFRQFQHDITYQLYSVSIALMSRDERQLSIIARQLHQTRYNLERVQFVGTDQFNLFAKVNEEQEKLIGLVNEMVEWIRSGQSPDLIDEKFNKAILIADKLDLLTNEMVNRAESGMLVKIDQTNDAYSSSKQLVIGFSIVCVLLALLLGYALSHSFLKPLKLIEGSLNLAALGDFSSRVEVTNRDELGSLSKNLNNMNQELDRLYRQLESINKKMEEKNIELEETLQQVELYSQMLSNELEKGRIMQKSFLPDNLPQIEGWELRTFFRPAKQVAGDFYDVFELPGRHLGLVVADVCDKGVGAALFMALFRSLIRIFSIDDGSEGVTISNDIISQDIIDSHDELMGLTNLIHLKPLRAIEATNNYIAQNHSDVSMFATMFFGVLDTSNGLLSYINGGHEPVIITRSQGGVKNVLGPSGPAVGMLPDIAYKIHQTLLESGDTLFAYTDGVSEAQSASNELFTKNRLLSLFQTPFESIGELQRRIEGELNTHIGGVDQSDDITFMTLRRIS